MAAWSTDPVPEGTWCWVYAGPYIDPITKEVSHPVFLAMHSADATGGWTNEDTWEDFDGEVRCWIPIEKPEPPTVLVIAPSSP